MQPIVVLVTGEPIAAVERQRGSFSALFRGVPGTPPVEWRDVDVRSADPPPLAQVGAALITGSPASVMERAPWMLRAEAWLRGAVAAKVPVLGVCFGHQLLGSALGGRVERNPRGRELGTVELRLHETDEVVRARGATLSVNMSHGDAVTRLPEGARSLASTALTEHAAVRFGPRVWGLQFHPEFDAAVVRAYVEARREAMQAEGLDAEAAWASARDCPEGAAILVNFLGLASAG